MRRGEAAASAYQSVFVIDTRARQLARRSGGSETKNEEMRHDKEDRGEDADGEILRRPATIQYREHNFPQMNSEKEHSFTGAPHPSSKRHAFMFMHALFPKRRNIPPH